MISLAVKDKFTPVVFSFQRRSSSVTPKYCGLDYAKEKASLFLATTTRLFIIACYNLYKRAAKICKNLHSIKLI